MKKTIAILLIAVMALSFVACAGKKLVGKWELTEVDGKSTVKAGITWEFTDDSKYIVDPNPEAPADEKTLTEGRFEVKGNKLYLDGETEGFYKFTVNGDTLKIEGAETVLTFKKK